MRQPMTQEEFELARVRHGANHEHWPADVRADAERFLASAEGAAVAADEHELDALLSGASMAGASDAEDTARADLFLDRLLDIPAEVDHPAARPQRSVKKRSVKNPIAALIADLKAFYSPIGLAGQGVAYALVLGVGIFVGLQGTDTEAVEAESVDLTASLFPETPFLGSDDLYLEDT